jgi:hypothetical protein
MTSIEQRLSDIDNSIDVSIEKSAKWKWEYYVEGTSCMINWNGLSWSQKTDDPHGGAGCQTAGCVLVWAQMNYASTVCRIRPFTIVATNEVGSSSVMDASLRGTSTSGLRESEA